MTAEIEKLTVAKLFRKQGFNFAMGVFDAIFLLLLPYIVWAIILRPMDDCDKSRWNRCGMEVHIDSKTGKEYLVTAGGGIIERGE